jgi:hypothetical protein
MCLRLTCLSAKEPEKEKPPSLKAAKGNCLTETTKPRPPGAEHRQTIAHGVIRGFPSPCNSSPGRGNRSHRLHTAITLMSDPAALRFPCVMPNQPRALRPNGAAQASPGQRPAVQVP